VDAESESELLVTPPILRDAAVLTPTVEKDGALFQISRSENGMGSGLYDITEIYHQEIIGTPPKTPPSTETDNNAKISKEKENKTNRQHGKKNKTVNHMWGQEFARK